MPESSSPVLQTSQRVTNKLKVFQLLNSSSFFFFHGWNSSVQCIRKKIFLDRSRNIIGWRREGDGGLRRKPGVPRAYLDIPLFCEKRNRSCAPRHIRRCVSKVRGANKRAHPLYLTRQGPQRRETNREERRR